MQIDSSLLGQFTLIAIGVAAAYLILFWLSLVIWTARDIHARSSSGFIRVLCVLLVLFLFLPGLLLYILLRPRHTLEQTYQAALNEEVLLRQLAGNLKCPVCHQRVEKEWIVCPKCHAHLQKKCEECGRFIQAEWDVCPYCATPVLEDELDGTDLSGFENFTKR